MAQIFVSHSSKDKDLVEFLSKAFASTQVKGIFEEFESICSGPADAQRIAGNIRQSAAVFVLMGPHLEKREHTRDWVAWESGLAAAAALETNKDVWVLDPIIEDWSSSMVVPHLRHYVRFLPHDDHWQVYLSQVIASYDDSHILTAVAVGGAFASRPS